jgi:uncharacterized protein
MHIWLDPALSQQESLAKHTQWANTRDDGVDCPSDCDLDCDCGYTPHNPASSPCMQPEHILFVWHHTLRCAQDLYLDQFDDTHWLACNPVQQGSVVVPDKEARMLLEVFRNGYSLQELANSGYFPDQSPTLPTSHIVLLFLALGLITDTSHPSQRAARRTEEPSVLSAWLHITNACNMNCSYCYIAKSQEHMSEDVGRRSVDAIVRSAVRYGYQTIRLKYAGGEALLRTSQILSLHDYAIQQATQRGLHIRATVLSNGLALTPRTIQQLQNRSIGVAISIDGIGAAHDAQRPLVNGKGSSPFVQRTIERLLEHKLIPHINVTVSQRNLPGLVDLVAYLLDRDLPFSFSYYRENDCSATYTDLQFCEQQMIARMKAAFAYIREHLTPRKIYGALLDKANLTSTHNHTCNAGHHYLVIDQRGGVARCQTEIQQTITTIDDDDPLAHVRAHQKGFQVLNVDSKEGCCTCNWRYWCAGGCAVVTYRLTGRNDIHSPNCGIYKALFPEVLRLEALRLVTYTNPLTTIDGKAPLRSERVSRQVS